MLRVLTARGVAFDDEARAQVLACDAADTLRTWLDRTTVAGSVDDVLRP